MPTELETYKKDSIDKLLAKYKSDAALLRTQLTNKINSIIVQNISQRLKKQYINLYTSNYNISIEKLKNKLSSDIKKINALTSIPTSTSTVPTSTVPTSTVPTTPLVPTSTVPTSTVPTSTVPTSTVPTTPLVPTSIVPTQIISPPLNSLNKYALLVGINYRNTSNQLSGCINDTTIIRNILNRSFGFNNFVFLTDDTATKPTKQNILLEFTKLLFNAVSGDSLFFFYSGHGTYTSDLNNDEDDSRDELIVPIDATSIKDCIKDDELNNIIKKYLKPGVKLFALFDSCFSGTVLDLKYNYLDSNNLNNITINSKVTETNGQVIMISGCTDTQTSADAVITENETQVNNGIMTYSFSNVIRINNLGANISLKSLLEGMRTLIQKKGYTQIPQLSSGKTLDINKQISVLLA